MTLVVVIQLVVTLLTERESLKNIVRSGITNQDNVDKKAISEELKNIVRSGILDLGILGL